MYYLHGEHVPQRLTKRPTNYVSNELIVTVVAKAENDDLPHYLSVAAGMAAPSSSYGDTAIDGVFQHFGARVRSVARLFVPQDIASSSRGSGMRALTESVIGSSYDDHERASGLARTYRIQFESEPDLCAVCCELKHSKVVERARLNYVREAQLIPSDEFYQYQWGPKAINCEQGWEIEQGHEDVVIAIVDSGVDLHHEDLQEKLRGGFDFVDIQGPLGWRYTPLGDYRDRDPAPNDEDGHGSHCAGIAAAKSENGNGVVGVCWGGSILPVRVMFRVYDRWTGRETSVGTDADIDAGIKFAIDAGAHVINLSLGGPEPSHETILGYAKDRNVCVIAATGNENSSAPSYPASNSNVLAVGALDQNLNRASFSNYNPDSYNRFVMAPGVQIASTYKDNSYVYLQGTSMATPFVSGLAGLIISLAMRNGHRITPDDVYDIIRKTATPLRTGKGDLFTGEGLINVEAALKATKEWLKR